MNEGHVTEQEHRVAPSFDDLGIRDTQHIMDFRRGLLVIAGRDTMFRSDVVASIVREHSKLDGMLSHMMGGMQYVFPTLEQLAAQDTRVSHYRLPDDRSDHTTFLLHSLRPAPDVVTIDILDSDDKKSFAYKAASIGTLVLSSIAINSLDEVLPFLGEYHGEYAMFGTTLNVLFFNDSDSDSIPEYYILE